MIECYIDGKRAVPSLKSEIKLTKENPFVKSGGSYTYDIVFPMDILENVQVFGAVQRLDVSKSVRKFSDCVLYAGCHLLIRGRGTVTMVSDSEIRLQIISASAASAYRDDFGSVYIDRIPYPEVASKYKGEVPDGNAHEPYWTTKFSTPTVVVTEEIRNKGYIGEAGKYVFMLTHVAGTDPQEWSKEDYTYANHLHMDNFKLCMTYPAVQPSLLYVMKTVLQYMGYTPDLSAYDCKPWCDLYIANATRTLDIARTLPHWTVRTLLDEFRKLFNAVIVFDEEAKTVTAIPYSESDNTDVEELEVMNEFESNYDDDGLEYLGASNIEYSLSGNHEEHVSISREVMNRYPVRDFNSLTELQAWRDSATEQELLTTFIRQHEFRTEELYMYYARKFEDSSIAIQPAGIFRPLFRDIESDTSVELKMVPVATETLGNGSTGPYKWYHRNSFLLLDDTWLYGLVVPVLEERPERSSEDGYVSIYEAIDEGEDPDKEDTEEDEIIELMFATSPLTYNTVDGVDEVDRLPKAVSDVYLYDSGKIASMSLYKINGIATIGGFHVSKTVTSPDRAVDGNNELCFKFPFDGIPDPMKRYNIRNKLYLCSKIEVKVLADGSIDQIKTGYFYEIIS